MEEIGIIELLKRVKEGNAPKKIEVKGHYYNYDEEMKGYFRSVIDSNCISLTADFDMFDILDIKIKILDKPTIGELKPNECYFKDGTELVYRKMYSKINEIIKFLNNKENKDE